MKRVITAVAFGLAVTVAGLGLGMGEAHARFERPIKEGPCSQYDINCKYSVIEDVVEPAEPGAEPAEFVIARMCLYCVR